MGMSLNGDTYHCPSCKKDIQITDNWSAPVQERGDTYCGECYHNNPENAIRTSTGL